jgi:hypothetical protein
MRAPRGARGLMTDRTDAGSVDKETSCDWRPSQYSERCSPHAARSRRRAWVVLRWQMFSADRPDGLPTDLGY